MPLSQLDANAALIVIDLQRGIVGLPTFSPSALVVERSAAIAKAFRASGRPVVLVKVVDAAPGRTDAGHRAFPEDPSFTELMPELEHAPTDHVVSKRRWGAFQTTDLDSWLRGKGVEQVVLVGIATSVGVESTARYANELGYHVVLVPDAMSDLNADAHENSVTRIFPRIGETTDTQTLLAKLG